MIDNPNPNEIQFMVDSHLDKKQLDQYLYSKPKPFCIEPVWIVNWTTQKF